jgi:hypothetical protein
MLREQGAHCSRLGWLDLHSGLGPAGHGERILACADEPAALARARVWWGDSVTSIYNGSSSSALLSGPMWLAATQDCSQAEYTGIALEFGTQPMTEVVGALRQDQWFENHPEAPRAQREAARRRLRDAFYTDTPDWKQRVVEQGLKAARQALTGLGGVQ